MGAGLGEEVAPELLVGVGQGDPLTEDLAGRGEGGPTPSSTSWATRWRGSLTISAGLRRSKEATKRPSWRRQGSPIMVERVIAWTSSNWSRSLAHGQPALAAYLPDSTGTCRGYGIMVLSLTAQGVAEIVGFPDADLFRWFDLPLEAAER